MPFFHRPSPLCLAVWLACVQPVLAADDGVAVTTGGATAEGTLPEVRVKASKAPRADRLITQTRPAQAGKSPASVYETPFSMEVIDVAQIRETGARSVEDALLYSAGVQGGRYGFDTRGDWAAIRGLSPAAYIDGLRSLYGYYNNVRPDLYMLERVEVLKGPSSVLYGQAELGGILNVVSKRPQATPRREIEVQLGSHNRKQVAADLTGPLSADGEWLYRLVALKRDSDTQVQHVADDALVLMPSVTWQPRAGTSVTALFAHQQYKGQVSSQFLPSKGTINPAPLGKLSSSTFVGEPGWDRYDTRKNELTLLVDQQLADSWRVAAALRKTHSASVTREHWATVGAVPTDAGVIGRNIYTADRKTEVTSGDVRLEGQVNLGPTRHQLAVGLDHQHAFWEEYNYAYGSGTSINLYNPVYGSVNTAALTWLDRPDSKLIQTGLYATDHVTWGPWVASAAWRRDHARTVAVAVSGAETTVHNEATTGRLGLMYKLPNGVSPYVSYSEAFVPNAGTDGTPSGGYLKPTEGEQKEAGLKYLSDSGQTSVNLAWFDIKERNRVATGSMPGGLEQVGAHTKGWEAEVRHRMGALELSANYTDMDAVNAQTGLRLGSVAERLASTWAQYRFQGGWRAGAGVRHTGSVTGANGQPVLPTVTLVDAMVGYTTGPWDFRFDVKNLADKTYLAWCRGLNQDCGYGARLNANLTARYTF